ncbi:hypothetical protein GE115_17865 [Agromyces sp. CFH 90414]|uniref:Uncharacterized protein n=1 Tax=Agromyces agglutinans TaxID=2662258 RepID=A0A6I2FM97_9MICO|nr:hypothetical protein [Agromyces agglutinans]MRG61728.1 hypothetical protein [Agromyces agglutinans]
MSAPDPEHLHDADLHHALAGSLRRAADASSSPPIDVDAVLRGTRLVRRHRRNVLVGATATVAAVIAGAGLFAGVATLGPSPASDSTIAVESAPDTGADAGAGAEAGEEAASGVAPADQPPFADDGVAIAAVFRCGEPIPSPTTATDASGGGLVATVRPDGAVVAGTTGRATLVLANTGAGFVTGRVSGASVAVVDAGVAVWRPPARGAESGAVPDEAVGRAIELAPGASVELPVEFRTERCDVDQASEGGSTGGAQPLAPGAYGLAASVAIVSDDRPGLPLVVVSEVAALPVH